MNKKEQIVLSIMLKINEDGKSKAIQQKASYNYYKAERNFWENKKDAIKITFSLSVIFTALVSLIVLVFMTFAF